MGKLRRKKGEKVKEKRKRKREGIRKKQTY